MSFFNSSNWIAIGDFVVRDELKTALPLSYSKKPLLIKVTTDQQKLISKGAGFIYQFVDIDGIGLLPITKKTRVLFDAINLVEWVLPNESQLCFEKAPWIDKLQIYIYQSLENMPQIYNEPSSSLAASAIAASNVAASATSISLAAANVNRKWIKIINTSATADLYIDYDGAASLLDYAEKIPRGGNNAIVISGDEWKGAIAGIWSAANGTAMIREAT